MEKFKMNKELLNKINDILEQHNNDKSQLLAILLAVQSLIPQNYIPEEVASYIAAQINMPTSKVYDVISFFSDLSEKPKGRHVIQICKSTVCRLNKYQTVRDFLQDELGIKMGETTEDGLFSLEYTACIGACDVSPAIKIDEKIYGNLDEAKLREIINSYRRINHG